jgi:hypothetical protein
LFKTCRENLLFLILACLFFPGGREEGGQGARCKVRGAQGFCPSSRARERRYWTLDSCAAGYADLSMQMRVRVRGDADLALGKFCPAEIGRGGGNLRSSDVRAECKIDIGRVREMLLRLSFQRHGCASFHHHYQWRALN